ncbi:DUF1513 domain-containing protein [Celeribacter arenosi]|uniref:DUF1513 domain-containing protein n=1 Tax=Celeribacter arenosi TaxID=792649 RepID=A0ABP7JY71_9RHOB
MPTRRAFIGGLAAASAYAGRGWAKVGHPAYLAAARDGTGAYRLFGLDEDGNGLFSVDLPDRGHAAAAHPHRAQAVAFARRPGTFAIVIDCETGRTTSVLNAPAGMHFYGHGAFSADGTRLFTTENEFDTATGMIGVWDVADGYRRIGSFASGGIGPHDVRLMPDGRTLVVANGGIETHPDSGRAKLNIPFMQPNLTYVSLSGEIVEQVEPEASRHMNSIRHLAVSPDGLVAFAMQWQGDVSEAPSLVALHRRGAAFTYLDTPPDEHRKMQGYAGSIAFSGNGAQVAITSPRGGLVQVFDVATARYRRSISMADVCGVAPAQGGFTITSGTGEIGRPDGASAGVLIQHDVQWDNHLVALHA